MNPHLAPEETERRLRNVSMLRNFVRALRSAAQEAYDRGEFPHPPQYDIRTDVAYWRRRAAELEGETPKS